MLYAFPSILVFPCLFLIRNKKRNCLHHVQLLCRIPFCFTCNCGRRGPFPGKYSCCVEHTPQSPKNNGFSIQHAFYICKTTLSFDGCSWILQLKQLWFKPLEYSKQTWSGPNRFHICLLHLSPEQAALCAANSQEHGRWHVPVEHHQNHETERYHV